MNNFVDTIKIELKRKTPEELSEKICELVTDNIIKDKKIEELKEQLNDEIDDELKQSEIMVKQQNEIERQKEIIRQLDIKNLELTTIIKEVREYIEKLLREETEITDEDNIDYGMKCQRAYFSDSELGKVLEILDKVDKENNNE